MVWKPLHKKCDNRDINPYVLQVFYVYKKKQKKKQKKNNNNKKRQILKL